MQGFPATYSDYAFTDFITYSNTSKVSSRPVTLCVLTFVNLR